MIYICEPAYNFELASETLLIVSSLCVWLRIRIKWSRKTLLLHFGGKASKKERLKPLLSWLETFMLLVIPTKCSNLVAAGLLHLFNDCLA